MDPLNRYSGYQGDLHRRVMGIYSGGMTTSTQSKYRCMQCEMTENRCECEKYCCLCQSQIGIRLCQDGLYYCEPCREACDYKVSADPNISF